MTSLDTNIQADCITLDIIPEDGHSFNRPFHEGGKSGSQADGDALLTWVEKVKGRND